MDRNFGEIETKDHLLDSLLSLKYSATYDIFAQICLHEFFKQAHRGNVSLSSLMQLLPEGEITLQEFCDEHEKLGSFALRETKRNANRFLTRNLLKETFRLTQSYAISTDQMDLLGSQHWYQFARIFVNSISHDFCYRFNKHDKKMLPVSFNGVEITKSMDGGSAKLTLQNVIELVYEIIAFARDKLG